MPGRHRPNRPLVASANLVAVLVLYFALPVNREQTIGRLALSLVVALACVAVVAVIIGREVGAQLRGEGTRFGGLQLLLIFEIVVVAFSLAYYGLSVHSDHEMAGLHTRLDALYFTLTTMTTVGYGDIHPVGQVARGIATLNLAFDLVFVAALARLIRGRLGHHPGDPPDRRPVDDDDWPE